jgi:SAM-dependent methyltransferase
MLVTATATGAESNLEHPCSRLFMFRARTGRFSIPLARQGFQVTHLDISQGMIDTARRSALNAGVLDRMHFERGRVGDLTQYENGRFDLVTCCDAPISYTYPDHVRTIAELNYYYDLMKSDDFYDYNIEQQASMVADYWAVSVSTRAVYCINPKPPRREDYFDFISQVQNPTGPTKKIEIPPF